MPSAKYQILSEGGAPKILNRTPDQRQALVIDGVADEQKQLSSYVTAAGWVKNTVAGSGYSRTLYEISNILLFSIIWNMQNMKPVLLVCYKKKYDGTY